MYSVEKTIEVAAFFLREQENRAMGCNELIKLIYLADREHLRRKGRAITGDVYWSLPCGPVLGFTLDAIEKGTSSSWTQHIRTNSTEGSCTLIKNAQPAAISRGEIQTLERVWEEFGRISSAALNEYTCGLPEYTVTDGKVEIRLDELARKLGKSEVEVGQILENVQEFDEVQQFTDQIKKAGKAVLV